MSTILAMNSLAGIERLHAGEKIKLPPKGQYFADIHDKATAHKASLKSTKKGQKGQKAKKSARVKSKSKVRTRKT